MSTDNIKQQILAAILSAKEAGQDPKFLVLQPSTAIAILSLPANEIGMDAMNAFYQRGVEAFRSIGFFGMKVQIDTSLEEPFALS